MAACLHLPQGHRPAHDGEIMTMGMAKRMLEEQEDLRQMALGVLCAAGCLEECEFHESYYFGGGVDLQEAYKIANARITSGQIELPDGVGRSDFTDIVKMTYEEH